MFHLMQQHWYLVDCSFCAKNFSRNQMIMFCILAWTHHCKQCNGHCISLMVCIWSKGVRGTPGERGETGQQGEVVRSVLKHFASIKYMWDGLCYWGYEWLIRSPPHLPGCSRRTGIRGDCGLSGSEGMFSPSLCFVFVSKTFVAVFGWKSHNSHSFLEQGNEGLPGAEGSRGPRGHLVKKTDLGPSAFCCMTFESHGSILN